MDRWFTSTLAPLIAVLLPEQESATRAAIRDDDAVALSVIARALAARAREPIAPGAFATIGRDLAATVPGGFRSAQQIAWGLDALAVAQGDAAERTPLRTSIARLFPALQAMPRFEPGAFAAALAEVRTRWR